MLIAVLAHDRRPTFWAIDYSAVVDQAALSCDETHGPAINVCLSDSKETDPAWLRKR
jgi:hypothetical protein